MSRCRAAVGLLALAACQGPEATSEAQRAIVGGSLDPGDPAVVAIIQRRTRCADEPALVCTGALVSPRVVLTAAHCVRLDGDVGGYEVVIGASLADPAAVFIVTSDSRAYPGFDDASHRGDVALLRLSEPAPVAPLTLPDAASAPVAGDAVRAVGFGVAQSGGILDGVKRTGAMVISTVSATSFDAVPGPGMTCAGDSGGPVFRTTAGVEELVAVTVAGDARCTTFSINDRLDDPAVRAFVAAYVADSATATVGSSPTATVTPDDACRTACATDGDCPDLMTCDPFAPGGGRCKLPGALPADFAEPCAVDSECGEDAYCARRSPSGAEACRCAVPCSTLQTPGTGCCAAAPGTATSHVLVALGVVLAVRGRRRRHRGW